jgi:hypothetical protein
MLELANQISKIRGVRIIHGDTNHGDSKRRLPDVSMNQKISWKATTNLSDGLAQLR